MDEYKELHEAGQAQTALEYLLPVFEQLKSELLKRWFETKTEEGSKREALWLEVHTVDKALAHITQIIETGKLARITLAKQKRN